MPATVVYDDNVSEGKPESQAYNDTFQIQDDSDDSGTSMERLKNEMDDEKSEESEDEKLKIKRIITDEG